MERTSAKGAETGPSTFFAVFVACCAALAFWPALWNGFVWDDQAALLDNYSFRGLGLRHLRWMFTTFRLGPYQPLAWMSLALDYLLHGMDPLGYHAANIVLHAANAAIFFAVARRLLDFAMTGDFPGRPGALSWGAATAALLFALHPLRVESVAWVTERRDVLSGFFYLSAVLFYLKHCSFDGDAPPSNGRLAVSVALYILSLLSKASGVTLPLVLIILDFYPLRRLEKRTWGVWLEKIPYLLPALAAAALALAGQRQAGAMEPLATYGLLPRLCQAVFGATFYLWKTLIPWRLLPLYRFPEQLSPLANWRIALSVLLFTLISIAAAKGRRTWPAGLAAWLCYLASIFPMLGFFQSGPQVAADRYSYLPCLGLALLGGAAVPAFLRAKPRPRALPALAVAAYLAGLGSLAWRQCKLWRDPVSLWSYAAAADPQSRIPQNNLCEAYRSRGETGLALEHCRLALALKPDYEDARSNLAGILADLGKLDEAAAQYEAALRLAPEDPAAHCGLANVLDKQGRPADAIRELELCVSFRPGDAGSHNALGAAFYRSNLYDRAVGEYRTALSLSPDDAEIHSNLGVALDAQGNWEQAARQQELAVRLKPDCAPAYNNLGIVLFKQGRPAEAVRSFQRALELDPGYADARFNLERAAGLLRRKK